uniref:RNI-like protein n=1 Tax=Hanusia phi TaxID=3032 RepID=A0A7S0EJ97_9CRYP|mmetsp:Transcript_25775/g.57994  ORF Transcript_25775/g.57994 Transcript_25775/m.57994 type:complete len:293 (+) Transcript_25775:1-879(+)
MGVGPVGLMSLISSIAHHSFRNVSTLYLSGNPIGGEGANHLILLLERSLSLTALDVSGCSLQDEGVQKIAQGLERNERLEYIDLGDNDVSDYGVNTVAAMLAAKGKRAINRQHLFPFSLKRIVLSTNNITSTGFGQFAAAVTIAHLSTIELSSCKITDNGCRAFSQHLANNRTLKLIDLSSNLLTADGVWVLAESIIANRSIESLRINDNRLLDSGGRGIATILNGNHHIQEVNVAGNGIGPKGLIPILKVLMMRPVPLELHIHGNPYQRDAKCLEYISKLEGMNRIVSVNQ